MTDRAGDARTVVLVEGDSDRAALVTLAVRRGIDLAASRIAVVPMGGAKNVRAFAEAYGPHGRDAHLAGLYDAGEEDDFRRGLQRAGVATDVVLDRRGLEAIGFFACDSDLEDELIRALGTERVEAVIDAAGELASLRALQRQPAQRARTVDAQLRRFMSSKSGRKVRYAQLLVEALDLDEQVPAPLDRALAYASAA
jgi:hypothetical protein